MAWDTLSFALAAVFAREGLFTWSTWAVGAAVASFTSQALIESPVKPGRFNRSCSGVRGCLPDSACCQDRDCTDVGANEVGVCRNNGCVYDCRSGYRTCPAVDGCIREDACCTAADCTAAGAHQVASCEGGSCSYACQANARRCSEGSCVPSGGCCGAADCVDALWGQQAVCVAGACDYPAAEGWVDAGRDGSGQWAAFEVGGVRVRMRYIEAGRFMMGSPEEAGEPGSGIYEDETQERQHEVELTRGYWLAETEVTQSLWEAVMGNNPSAFAGRNRPVESVSWDDVQAMITALNARLGAGGFRLPTEAEWEYACRAGTTSATYAGDLTYTIELFPSDVRGATELEGIAWCLQNSDHSTHDVALKMPNAWGLYDTLGNVEEWCSDWHGDYPYGAVSDPSGAFVGDHRVVRGCTAAAEAVYCRAAYRYRNVPGGRDRFLGFRLARGAAP